MSGGVQESLGLGDSVPGDDRDRLARVALCQAFEPGDLRVEQLVSELGAATLLDLLRTRRELDELADGVAARLHTVQAERDLERAQRLGIRFVVPGDEEWPACVDDLAGVEPLQGLGGRPLGLWVRGPHHLDELGRAVAVVGSRAATTYGTDVTAHLAADLAGHGQVVVSGLAYGIDQAAHRGALAVRGLTVAVLANGIDRAYPTAHQHLLDTIVEEGLVVSELAPGCSPSRQRFLSRNRVIAALGRGTVIVEAAVRSGALNTANWAGRLHRVVMGVPGPVTIAQSQGVHQLLRTGAATVVTSGPEVLEVLGESGEHLLAEPRAPERPRDRLPAPLRRVLEAVPVARPTSTESVARTAGMGTVAVRGSLGRLAAAGFVEGTPLGWRLAQVDGRPVIPD